MNLATRTLSNPSYGIGRRVCLQDLVFLQKGAKFADGGEFAGSRDAGQVQSREMVQERLDIRFPKPPGVIPVDTDRLKPRRELAKVVAISPDGFGREILPLKRFNE